MIELEYIHPSQIRASQVLSPLAKAFEDALMQVEIGDVDDGNDEIEKAIADAVFQYSLIGLSQRAIIGRLIHHI
jgi:hypothetical protein